MSSTTYQPKTYNWSDPLHIPPFPQEFYSSICVKNASVELIKMLVGKNGFYLKQLTENNNMCYIWHDQNEKLIKIWGEESKHNTISKQIISKMNQLHKYIKKKNNNDHKYHTIFKNIVQKIKLIQ